MIGGAKGIGIGLDFGIGNIKRPTGSGAFLDPSVKEALCGVWIADQNTNESPTRNIIKNKLKDRGGDFEILNAAYKLNSGYGKYDHDFTTNWYTDQYGNVRLIKTDNKIVFLNDDKVSIVNWYNLEAIYIPEHTEKISIKGLKEDGYIRITIKQLSDLSDNYQQIYKGKGNGIHTVNIPESYRIVIYLYNIDNQASIEQIPSYQGAFVTDGVDDLIVSQKSVSEMIDGGDEFTVVSMWANLDDVKNRINVIRNVGTNYSQLYNNKPNIKGKCYIAGYSYSKGTFKIINDILGDKNDHIIQELDVVLSSSLSVEGYLNTTTNNINEVSKIAYYNTFIAKRVLTTDEINQVIAYYNLDKYVAPDVYYNVKKQGLTNDNHEEFGDKLIDYSSNGKDMQLYNIGWEGMSGVNGYPVVFGANKTWEKGMMNYDGDYVYNKIHITKVKIAGNGVFFSYVKEYGIIKNIKEIPSFRIKVSGLEGKSKVFYRYLKTENATVETILVLDNGIHELPKSFAPTDALNNNVWVGFSITPIQDGVTVYDCNITIEVLPEYENSIVFDGATDYGQYVGDLGLKDYTVVADRAYSKILNRGIPIISSTEVKIDTPFIMEYDTNSTIVPYSFGTNITLEKLLNIDRKISYQSAYVYNGNSINRGTSINTGNGLTFGRFGAEQQYAALCLYSFMLFPYTLSEFLLERQLKKRKLGTLYPDMVEWRPVINADMSTIFDISFKLNDSKTISVGEYIPINSGVSIRIDLIKYQLDEVSLLKVNGQAIQMRELGDYWKGDFTVTKSPQKIDITIDEYIRYEDIVMPYPFIPNLYWDDEFKNPITYGDKLKVGSTIYGHLDRNILPELYTRNRIIYKGATVNRLPIVVEKQMVFGVVSKVYLKDNEPKCILSPERLSIPNSSYKILGYIPDISGHGNHGKLNNSAYAGGSGANGYPYNYKEGFATQGKTEILNDNKVLINGLSSAVNFIKLSRGYKGKIAVTGITKNINTNNIFELKIYTNTNNSENTEAIHVTSDGIYDVNISGVEDDATNVFFFVVPRMYNDNFVPITIQQIGKYDGSYGLDGVDDFISIPTLSAGGKQVLMKVNWNNETGAMLYDQRTTYNTAFAIYVNGSTIAYNSLNAGGNTYIDGTLNNSITCMALKDITHNTTCLNSSELPSQSPKIGTNFGNSATFSTMSLYTFMLFDEISTEEKIKELNEIVGIEGNTNDLFNPTN